ncbi:polyphosphate kinase 1 [Leptolyngbya sp. FACHB-261]|uniref:polyphosphate kinase 1 n=1 Tax=Leptolyngbya sp. FACHB-261 TaxID=2692806 RepID=UPI0016885054|nr:polyphosphate kinase 1 [Leptolyngbya sp. FACHB-261]MBD2102599.1 polyphosphate kinase 1 [Leptolyngbya sp. FACHB-261]
MSRTRKSAAKNHPAVENDETSASKRGGVKQDGIEQENPKPVAVESPEHPADDIEIDFSAPQYFLNRELSWLEFNYRVLREGMDERTPLLERLKFLAIFSSNLDEYFMVRIAALKQQVEADVRQLTPDGRTPAQQLHEIAAYLRVMLSEAHTHFEQVLRPVLSKEGIHILEYFDLTQEQRAYLNQYFEAQLFPVLTPLAVDPGHPFPYISNLSLSLAVQILDDKTGEEHFARVKVPGSLPRFVALPEELRRGVQGETLAWAGVPLEQVIAHNLDTLFPGMKIQAYYPFRVTRNADLALQEDEADDLLLAIEEALRKRRFGPVVRMEIDAHTPPEVREMLMQEMKLAEDDVYEIEGALNLGALMPLMSLPLPHLKDPDWSPITHPRLRRLDDLNDEDGEEKDIFAVIRKGDILLHHPYDSFATSVQRFITQAASDPNVLAIKQTLYRTSGDSPIVNALIQAADNGKQVAVLVELKARFDEASNIVWTRRLEEVGVHVVYGLVGLKTHTKTALVVRREGSRIRRYAHIGTGNYNSKTARLYTDLGILTCREDIGADLSDLFNYLTGYSRQRQYRKLMVAPVNLRQEMLALIQREIEHVKDGRQGRIVAKMNALVDPETISQLYRASCMGVKIDLIIRGMCALRPGVPKVSENIRVISIIGRFLEHSRIFYFHNGGDEQIFIGSADWMRRNLDRRVEVIIPVEEPYIAKELQEILGMMLSDNRQAWELQPDGTYMQRRPAPGHLERGTQYILMDRTRANAG